MTPEQKQRAAELLSAWRATAYALHADRMAALLQEMVDAPEPDPVARVTGYYAGYLSIATVDGRVLPAGTALYLAPPAPSVPDGWKLVPVEPTPEPFGYFKAEPFGWTDCAETDDGAIALFDAPPAPTPAEAPADVARGVRLQVEAEFAALLPGVTYMDEPDGGSPTVQEQVKRMAKDAERYRLLRKRYWSGNLLDAEVDAAIVEQQRGTTARSQ